MILTVTMNPSVDTRYQLDELIIDDVNRVTPEKTAGGKGLNVARVLGQLGDDVVATGLLGGHMGAYMAELMDANGINNDFVPIKGETRICLNILHAGNQTELLESGPTIAPEELDAFTAKFTELAGKADVVTISGSLPRGVEADYYAKITGIAENAGAKVLLDTSVSLPSASTLKTVTIPETVKAIGNYAFAGSKIEKLTLNSGLESILTSAFSGCTNLSSVSFSDSIISICDSSFEECTSLKNLKFGKNLEFISYYAFYNCQNLQSVTIGENVKAICCDSFGNCDALVINGKIGSTAETFAKKYGYKFNSSEVTRLKGDVDNNGIINVVDATNIQKYVVNLKDENGNKFIDINNAEDVYVADVNGDGIINVVDATLIQKYLVRLVESL